MRNRLIAPTLAMIALLTFMPNVFSSAQAKDNEPNVGGFGTDSALSVEKPGPNKDSGNEVNGKSNANDAEVHVEKDRTQEQPQAPVAPSAGTLAAATYRCPAFVTWQDWLGGARVHAYVDFRPSDWCNGRHVKRAYIRLIRQCGPYYDTGRIYTYTAGSSASTSLYSVSAWIFDSVLWGCTTYTYYGYEYF